MSASLEKTEAGAPPWIADTTPDPHPPDMGSESAPPRDTGSMPSAAPHHLPAPRVLPLADSQGWRAARPLRAPPPPPPPKEARKRVEKAVVAPAVRPTRWRLSLSVRAVAAFSLGAVVTVMAGELLDRAMTGMLAAGCAVVVFLWMLVCFELR